MSAQVAEDGFCAPQSLLAGARKYRVGLVLAHQELRQFHEPRLEASVMTNASTRVCFRLGDEDARKLAHGFSAFDATDLQCLGIGEAVGRIERADHDFNLRVCLPEAVASDVAEGRRMEIRALSREKWGTPREHVDQALATLYAAENEDPRSKPARESRESLLEAPKKRKQVALPEGPRTTKKVPTRVSAAVATPPRQKRQAASQEPGRGGPKHKYLQSLIKHFAEERGFRASVEATLSLGGRVDVLLQREEHTIACEISVSSTPEQELGNVRKCLESGSDQIMLISPDRRRLTKMSAYLDAALEEEERSRITCSTPEEFLAYLDALPVGSNKEETVLGYRVRTNVRTLDPKELATRKDAIARTIARSLRRRGQGS